ncbi:hypothetical protein [Actinomyces naeslundii]|uniref:hypothetical protein n=1 Tax=Actinomyces naeslundii TaxID=1655 RepID=UPI001177B1C1|nr:hypothetical protein [Actinomyces naeslundii]
MVDALVNSGLIIDGEADIVTVHLGVYEALAEASDRSFLEEVVVLLGSRVQADESAFMLSFCPDVPSLAEATALTVTHCLEWNAEVALRECEANEAGLTTSGD